MNCSIKFQNRRKKCFKTTSNLKLKRRFDFQLGHFDAHFVLVFQQTTWRVSLGICCMCHSINKFASFQHNRPRMLNNTMTNYRRNHVCTQKSKHQQFSCSVFNKCVVVVFFIFHFSNWYLETVFSLFGLVWLNGTKFSVSNFSCTFQNGNNTKSRRKR